MQKSTYVRKITVLAVLAAVAAVCSFTFPVGLTIRLGSFIKLSPAFIAVALAGSLFGYKGSALVALLADLMQGLLFGSVSVLILAVSTLSGAAFGLLLKKSTDIKHIALSVLMTQLVGSLMLTTSVLCLRYGMPFFPTVYWRMLQTAILIAVEIPLLHLLLNIVSLPEKIRKM